MKDLDTKQRFIELRAKDMSYDVISQNLSVSKPTLITWGHEFEDEITNLRYIQTEQILEQYKLLKANRIEMFSRLLRKMLDEADRRELNDVRTKDLIQMIVTVEQKLGAALGSVMYRSGFEDPIGKLNQDWETTFPLPY